MTGRELKPRHSEGEGTARSAWGPSLSRRFRVLSRAKAGEKELLELSVRGLEMSKPALSR